MDVILERISIKGVIHNPMRTQINIFGWAECNINSNNRANYFISLHLIYIKIRKLYERSDAESLDKTFFSAAVCTIRYYLMCCIAAVGGENPSAMLLESITNGLSDKKSGTFRAELREAKQITLKIINSNDRSAFYIDIGSVLKHVSSAAGMYGVVFSDIYNEEFKHHRDNDDEIKRYNNSASNIPTHDIEFFMVDDENVYHKIINIIRVEYMIRFNILLSHSETLVPDELAFAKLVVNCRIDDIEIALSNAQLKSDFLLKNLLSYKVTKRPSKKLIT